MSEPALEQGEVITGSWHVFMGDPRPSGTKLAGKLYTTNRTVRFQGNLMLLENAAAQISNRIRAFKSSDDSLTIPFDQIVSVTVTKMWLILKTLHITLKDGTDIPIHFGAMSPDAALGAIRRELK